MSNKKFEAHLRTVGEFLTQHSEAYYRAPAWQRFYVWDKGNVERLLSDAKQAQQDKAEHFLGAIIRTRVEPKTSEYLIIDGQQRLTTITLALLAIASLAPTDVAKDKYATLATFDREGQRRVRWTPTSLDTHQMQVVLDDVFEEIHACLPPGVTPEGQSKGDLLSAYSTIRSLLHDLSWADRRKIADGLLDRCLVVDIVVPEGVDPMQVFASINSMGKPLQASDLIRNSVFQRFGTDRKKMDTFREKYWMGIDEPLVRCRLHEQFFGNLAVQKDPSATKAKTFAVLSADWEGKGPVPIAKEIAPYLTAFLSFAASEGMDLPEESQSGQAWRDLHEALVRIRHVDSKSAWPYLMALMKGAQGKGSSEYSNVAKCVRLVEALFVRRLLGGLQNTGTRYFFVDLYGRPGKPGVGSDPLKLKEAIYRERNGELRGPSDGEIKDLLLDVNVYDKRLTKGARYLLETHERVQHGWTYPELLEYFGNADHIMPRSPKSLKRWGMTRAEHEASVNRIGNIVLLDEPTNQEKSNLGGAEKDDWDLIKGIYIKAPFYTRPAGIAANFPVCWGLEEIEERTENLCHFAFSTPDGWPSFE